MDTPRATTTKLPRITIQPMYQEAFINAKKRARIRNSIISLTASEFSTIIKRAGGKCEVTGIRFQETMRGAVSQYSRNPWGPSLDRINCLKGYTADNCRLVCTAANIGMNVWGESVLFAITAAIVDSLIVDTLTDLRTQLLRKSSAVRVLNWTSRT